MIVVTRTCVLSAQLCLTLDNPTDCIPPGSSVHGVLQTRTLEWVAILSPGNLPDPGIEPGTAALQVDSVPSEPPGMPSCHKYSLLTSSVYLPQSTWPVFWL